MSFIELVGRARQKSIAATQMTTLCGIMGHTGIELLGDGARAAAVQAECKGASALGRTVAAKCTVHTMAYAATLHHGLQPPRASVSSLA